MKKFYYLRGKSEGGLWEMTQGQKSRGAQVVHLAASIRQREDLYRIYNFIDERVVITLATLSKYGAHRVVLLPDNIVELLKKYTTSISSKVCWFIKTHPAYTDFEWVVGNKILRGRVVKFWLFGPLRTQYNFRLIYGEVPCIPLHIVGHEDDLERLLLKVISMIAEGYTAADIQQIQIDIEKLKSEVSMMSHLPNDEAAKKVLDEWKEKNLD